MVVGLRPNVCNPRPQARITCAIDDHYRRPVNTENGSMSSNEPIDYHCHLSVQFTEKDVYRLAAKLSQKSPTFHLMSTYAGDLQLLDRLLDHVDGCPVVPYYGVHPWYSHLFSTGPPGDSAPESKRAHYESILHPPPSPDLLEALPDPINMDDHIKEIRRLIAKHSQIQYGIGEIGLDKAFRIPTNGYFGAESGTDPAGPKLSPCRVSLDHQLEILNRQLCLADELAVPVSVHCVKAHGALYDAISPHKDIRVVLHSYSGSVDQAKMWIRNYDKKGKSLRFSFSNWINGVESKIDTLSQIVQCLDPEQVLGETDMSLDEWLVNKEDDYWAGLKEIYRKIHK